MTTVETTIDKDARIQAMERLIRRWIDPSLAMERRAGTNVESDNDVLREILGVHGEWVSCPDCLNSSGVTNRGSTCSRCRGAGHLPA